MFFYNIHFKNPEKKKILLLVNFHYRLIGWKVMGAGGGAM
jgi:hypothetical protein